MRETLLASCPVLLVPRPHACVAAELTSIDAESGGDAFLQDFADWLMLSLPPPQQQQQQQQRRSCQDTCAQVQLLPGVPHSACTPQVAALVAGMGQDLLAQARCWGLPALQRLLCARLDGKQQQPQKLVDCAVPASVSSPSAAAAAAAAAAAGGPALRASTFADNGATAEQQGPGPGGGACVHSQGGVPPSLLATLKHCSAKSLLPMGLPAWPHKGVLVAVIMVMIVLLALHASAASGLLR